MVLPQYDAFSNAIIYCIVKHFILSVLSNGISKYATTEFRIMKFVAIIVFSLSVLLSGAAYADVAAGQSAYAAKGCIGCHGVGGQSMVPTYPVLKGRDSAYIMKNLIDYRSGARQNATMNAMAAGLSDADIKNLGDYIGSLN
ncbi:MAG: cytochrome c553 [Flavobacteriales bacterium]